MNAIAEVIVDLKLPALSISQPWAWLIVNGYKDIENRTWATARRGMHFIHTGKKFDHEGYAWIRAKFPAIAMPHPSEFELGGIVGMADIVDCIAAHPSPWYTGDFAFVLHRPAVLPFIPCKGALGFFKPKLEVK